MPSAELEELLARAIDEALQGLRPDLQALAGGDEHALRRLQAAFDQALKLLPPPGAWPWAAAGAMRRFGPYRVERALGHGGMGAVLLARHETLDREAALKVLPHPLAFVAEHRERFRREMLALARLKHPGVLTVHEVGEQDGIPFAALEYVQGGSLEDVLRPLRGSELASSRERGRVLLPGQGTWELRVAGVFVAVADALDCIHRAGIVHRDIKPANILMDVGGRVVLGDFGLALQGEMETLTQSGAIVGTRRYLAPELTQPRVEASPASDIYALGVSLYELLTLQAPFGGDSEEVLFRAIREQEPALPRRLNRHVPRELEAVCLQALEKSPSRRYASAADLAADLRAVVRGDPVRARGASPWRRASRIAWSRRRRIAAAAAVLLAVATPVLAGVLVAHNREDQARIQSASDRARFEQLFQEGQACLDTDERGNAPRLLRLRDKALDNFLQCTVIDPGRGEAWLSAAEAAWRLERSDDARKDLERARALGATGFYFHFLEDWPKGFEDRESVQGIVQEQAWHSWTTMDKVALARVLCWQGLAAEAWKILEDPAVKLDPIWCVDLLQGVQLGVELANDQPQTLFTDKDLQARLAVAAFDRFLDRHPGDPTVSYNRAVLIRDGACKSGARDAATQAQLRSVEPFFREYAAAEKTPEGDGELLKLLLARWTCGVEPEQALSEAQALIESRPDEALLRLPPVGYYGSVETLVLAEQYEHALRLLQQRNFEVAEAKGPLHMLLLDRLSYAGAKLVSSDAEALRAFFEAHSVGLSEDERSACEAALAGLSALPPL